MMVFSQIAVESYKAHVRCCADNGLRADMLPYLFFAEIVEVENRTTPKISRKLIFRQAHADRLEVATDQAIAACGGDARNAVKTLLHKARGRQSWWPLFIASLYCANSTAGSSRCSMERHRYWIAISL
jgi:hypothetical protein